MSAFTVEISGVQWQQLGGLRVALWPKESQPDAAVLTDFLPREALDQIEHITHGARRTEWLATRVLSRWLTGELPSEGASGEPVWCNGWSGSISHKAGHVALCLTRETSVTCGVDLELCRELDPGVRAKIMNANEWQMCQNVFAGDYEANHSSTLVFAAKEAIYKALFPLVGKVFWFEAVELMNLAKHGDETTLVFRVCKDLSSEVSTGMEIRANAKIALFSGAAHWLVVARHSKVGRFE